MSVSPSVSLLRSANCDWVPLVKSMPPAVTEPDATAGTEVPLKWLVTLKPCPEMWLLDVCLNAGPDEVHARLRDTVAGLLLMSYTGVVPARDAAESLELMVRAELGIEPKYSAVRSP